MFNVVLRVFALTLAVSLLAACGGAKEDDAKRSKGPPATPVTVAVVKRGSAITSERVLGRVESATSPQVNAEVPGTLAKVLVDVGAQVRRGQVLAELDQADLKLAVDGARAEVGRIEALYANQQRTVKRLEQLMAEKLISEGALEEAQAQLKSLAEQHTGARARLASAERGVHKTRVLAPVDGIVAARHVAAGDYVDAKARLFEIATSDRLRVHLPFPETLAPHLRPGLTVRMSSPLMPDRLVSAKVDAVRPTVNGSRAVEAIVQIQNPGLWSIGASVNAELVLDERPEALLVPELAVVNRPAGEVVYVLAGETVSQRKVVTGVSHGGFTEIVSGLQGDETVVVDGAGFLTDKARVQPRS